MILNVDLDSYDDFNELGEAFEKKFPERFSTLKLAHGIIKIINSTALIDFAREWFNKKDQQFGNAID